MSKKDTTPNTGQITITLDLTKWVDITASLNLAMRLHEMPHLTEKSLILALTEMRSQIIAQGISGDTWRNVANARSAEVRAERAQKERVIDNLQKGMRNPQKN